MMAALALMIGIWTTNCTQTQSNTNQGFARDTYSIAADGAFEFKRDWFKNSSCSEYMDQEVSNGTIQVVGTLSGMFASGQSYEVNFNEANGTDLGAIAVNGGRSLKFARGMKNSTMRNTMVNFIEFIKQ